MKKIVFTTSNGVFEYQDGVGEEFAMDATHQIIQNKPLYNLSQITEQEASKIVCSEYVDFIGKHIYRDYRSSEAKEVFNDKLSAIDSLISLLHQLGIHSFNNPYIFKL